MKGKFVIILLFCFLDVFCQSSGEIKLLWSSGGLELSNTYVLNVPKFQQENLVYDYSKNMIFFRKAVAQHLSSDESSLLVSNLQTEVMPPSELGTLEIKNLQNQPNFSLQNIDSRNVSSVILHFNPIYKVDGVVKKVVSFNYEFKERFQQQSLKASRNSIQNSVLGTGVWKRFYIENTGVYKITKAFLRQIGVNTNVDPRTLKIYSHGGRMLPLRNDENLHYDLPENSIQFVGEEDGIFDDSDYILMYCEGLEHWNADSQTHLNLFADKAYYYVTTGGDAGKRIQKYVEPNQTATATYDKFDHYTYHEKDVFNIGELGRKWFGENLHFSASSTFEFAVPELDVQSDVSVRVSSAATSATSSSLKVSVNGTPLNDIFFSGISDLGSVKAVEGNSVVPVKVNGSKITVNLAFNNNGNPSAKAYLNYIALETKAFLKGTGKQYVFGVNETKGLVGVCAYSFTNFSAVKQIWDVTDITQVSAIAKTNEAQFSFKAEMGELRRFAVVEESDLYSPKYDSSTHVANQDLKGTIFKDGQNVFKDVDYLIITSEALKPQAEKLADFHRSYSKLQVKVVTKESIFNEFSSGKQDVAAIRNFIKYVYDNYGNLNKQVKYVCLFGDASFDYKNRIRNNTNIVPVFQSLDSYTLFSSFVSDDFYGLMGGNEGKMEGAHGVDIAVGRILVSTAQQAEEMVLKIKEYHSENAYGRWRNAIALMSDDVDKVSDATLEVNLESISEGIKNNKSFFNVKKIFMDAYVQETTSGGQKYPKAKEDFLNAFTQGSLVVDYLGHGSEEGLTGERMFDIADTKKLSHQYKYPLFITVTCEFTRFDNPLKETGGEIAFQNPIGGPIALISTTRQIGQFTGETFNTYLAPILLRYNGYEKMTLAEVLRVAKNVTMSTGNNVISFIGDPAMYLAIPEPKIKVTKINDIALGDFTGSLQALSKVKITGEVTDENDTLLTDFSGELFVNVFDKFLDKSTLANDGTVVAGTLFKINFKTLGETIFRGNASVKNGLFDFSFVVPKDIAIPVGNGKVSFYANNNQKTSDKTGQELQIKVGGVNVNAPVDNIAPVVKLYMNDKNFVSGGNVNQSPVFIAELFDENGINTASGVGHDIIVYLDGKETELISLNNFYNTEKDDFTRGTVRYQFKDLAPGLHTLTFKAWDVYNNLVTAELQFIVIDDSELKLTHVLNYPNPFVNYTEFWFNHNKPFEPLEVQVQVLTVTGKVVWTKNTTVTTEGFTSRAIVWDGKDDFGDRIGKGVYVYRLTVKSMLSNKKSEKFEKLVIF